jgi:ubiquinone/menaquinone biosynthesis C-methylase UbiE
MNHETAKSLIEPAIQNKTGVWADIGAGTGTFTVALQDILTEGTIYATDKSTHMLWRLEQVENVKLVIEDADFTKPMNLPELDGIILANALHYSFQPEKTLKKIISHLKVGGALIFIEYELKIPRPPYIPFPIPQAKFRKIAANAGLSEPIEVGKVSSAYGHQHIYSVSCEKL